MPPATPPVGSSVYFMSGRLLGQVHELADAGFLVLTDDDKLWLRFEAIFTVEGNRVTLVCEPNGLANYLAAQDE